MEPFHHGRCHLYHLVRYGYALAFALGYLIMAVVADLLPAQDSIRARSSTAWLTYCSPWAVLDRISFSLLIPTAGADHAGERN